MWIMRWTKYPYSKGATVISFIGALTRYLGAAFLISGLITESIITFLIGIGIHFLAEAIAKNKQPKPRAKPSNPAPSNAAQAAQTAQAAQKVSQPAQKASQPASQPAAASAPDKKRCANCGAEVAAQSAFCNHCGSSMAVKTNRVKKCLRCGEVLETGSAFCNHCGYQVKTK